MWHIAAGSMPARFTGRCDCRGFQAAVYDKVVNRCEKMREMRIAFVGSRGRGGACRAGCKVGLCTIFSRRGGAQGNLSFGLFHIRD